MKITKVRTRVFEWKGKIVPAQSHFCTNASDILFERSDAMGSFRFHGWLVVEIETDAGLVGIGNCALAPRVGYVELKKMSPFPISGGEHEFTSYGFKDLLERRAVDVIQYDTNRVGGITAAQKINAMAEAWSVPVIPHAGQMHNYHLTMASTASPMSEFFPVSDVEVGNELFYYVFKGEPHPHRGFLQLDDDLPGLGITISEERLHDFNIIE